MNLQSQLYLKKNKFAETDVTSVDEHMGIRFAINRESVKISLTAENDWKPGAKFLMYIH